MTTKVETLAEARAALAALDARPRRPRRPKRRQPPLIPQYDRHDLPAATCGHCGAQVRAGEGTIAREDVRVHARCFDAVYIVHEVTGLDVSDEVALTAVLRAHPRRVLDGSGVLPARPPGAIFGYWWGRLAPQRPWAHLTDADREAFKRIVAEVEREHTPKPRLRRCTSGACGFCGVSISTRWWASPLRWSDGAPAPACAACYAVQRRRPRTTDLRRLRAVGIEALSGASGLFLADELGDEMRLFVELVEPGHPGTTGRWEYAADAWTALREKARRMYPHSLPDDIRGHYLELVHAERDAEEARRRHEAETARKAELARAGWPV